MGVPGAQQNGASHLLKALIYLHFALLANKNTSEVDPSKI